MRLDGRLPGGPWQQGGNAPGTNENQCSELSDYNFLVYLLCLLLPNGFELEATEAISSSAMFQNNNTDDSIPRAITVAPPMPR